MIDPAEDAPEDLGAILRVAAPPDDSGAETLDRYEWQAMMATVDLLAMYMDAIEDPDRDPYNVADCGLVCEYHEDWVRIAQGDVQLVSGKHKEPSFGAYTTGASLLGDGGLYHLFDRWHSLHAVPGCRLVTTAGLSADAAGINQACQHFRTLGPDAVLPDGSIHTSFDRLCAGVEQRRAAAGEEPLTDLATTVLPRFLAAMTFQCGEPRRDHLPVLAPTAYAEPVAQSL